MITRSLGIQTEPNMHNFTPNDLLLYVLNELDESKVERLEKRLPFEIEMQKEIAELRQSLQDLHSLELNPNPKSLKVILNQLQEADQPIQIV